MTGPAPIISDSALTDVGGLPVHRSLPRRERRMVGAWSFLDRFGPLDVTPQRTMTVGPHPHIGLHTVTWLLSGQVLHSDSLGSQENIRPGQLNVMTAGDGVAHAEDARGQPGSQLDGVQLWVAQPEATRHGPPSFAHHEDLPVVNLASGRGTVLVGEFADTSSPARVDSPLVGVDLIADGPLDLPLIPGFEYAIAVLHGSVEVEGAAVAPNQLVYLGTGRDGVRLGPSGRARLLLLGGAPFTEEILMWWNFVARDRFEMERAFADWGSSAARFGHVVSTLDRIEAPRPYWMR
jgi:redox-sensitive bicupin YhaK (pirin superfamily)